MQAKPTACILFLVLLKKKKTEHEAKNAQDKFLIICPKNI
jgi:hypothetical protein